MRVLFVAALGAALLSTPAAAGIKAYCEQMREVLAPVFRAAVYHSEREFLRLKRREMGDSCFQKYPYDQPRQDRCGSKILSKYPELNPLPDSEYLDQKDTNRALLKMAPLYSAYCKKF